MSKTKDKMNHNIHLLFTKHTCTRSRARAIFSDIPIVLKGQVYVQWILPKVNYACETCNLTTEGARENHAKHHIARS